MFTVVIAEKEGAERRVTFTETEVTIGRVPGNDVVLPKGNVSKRHSRIVLKDNRFIVVDLKSTNGTFVNGRKITSPLVVKEGDKIYVGDYVLTLEGAPALDALKPPSLMLGRSTLADGVLRPQSDAPSLDSGERLDDDDLPAVLREGNTLGESSVPSIGPEPSGEQSESEIDEEHLLPAESELELFEERSSGEQPREPTSDVHAAKIFPPPSEGHLRDTRGAVPGAVAAVRQEPIATEKVLGPLDAVLTDPDVFHIVVERFDRIRADRGHGLTLEKVSFDSPQALVLVAEEIHTLAGIPLGTASFDVSLPNGLQVVGLMPAAASNGAVLSVRRRPTRIESLIDLAQQQVVSAEIANKLEEALLHKRHVWLLHPSGLDAASFFASVVAACPENERLALFERAPEVAIGERSTLCIKLGSVPLSELLERVRSFRPDRLAVYGVREDELATVLESFAHRADGNITAFEARSAKDALAAFARAVGSDVTMRAASLLVELRRGGDGRVRVHAAYDIELDGSGELTLKPT